MTAIVSLIFITVFSLSGNEENIALSNQQEIVVSDTSNLSYYERIDSLRAAQAKFYKKDEESPFVKQKEKFKGLKYFAPDSSFRVSARVESVPMGEVFNLKTSDGRNRNYKEVARLFFKLAGEQQELMLLQSMDKEHYFLPFFDQTSAESTYGAGRYLEVDYSGTESEITLDFNRAYNPYCAYVKGYSCPVPPSENMISVAVEAGEKIYKK